jgi:hypothetical protein
MQSSLRDPLPLSIAQDLAFHAIQIAVPPEDPTCSAVKASGVLTDLKSRPKTVHCEGEFKFP